MYSGRENRAITAEEIALKLDCDTWHLIPAGTVAEFTLTSIPEIGIEEGKPITFDQETLQFVYLARSSYVLYWAKGKYWVIWTAD